MLIEGMKARMGIIIAVILLAVFSFAPNLFDKESVPGWLPAKQLVYGLDIQGGLHLVMGVDSKGVLEEKLERLAGALKEDINKETAGSVTSFKYVDGKRPKIELTGNTGEISKYVNKFYAGVLQNTLNQEGVATFQYYETYENEVKKQVVEQAIEVIRNRVDAFGVAEPNIAAQGDKRIIVQLPGIDDTQYESAKDLINRAARLEFMILNPELDSSKLSAMIKEAEVAGNYQLGGEKENGLKYPDYVKRVNRDLKSKLPEQSEIVFQRLGNVEKIVDGKTPILVSTAKVFTGDKINDAFVSRDEYGAPTVDFSVATDGRNEFADLTGSNVGKPMGIVLDKILKTAPNINSKIRERGTISLGRGGAIEEEAKFVATTLRAGALPAALEQLEERTVGPTLGADSVAAGKRAGMIGMLLVLMFMLVWYRGVGLISGLALTLNVFLILAILTSLGATLTLPGIAGIILTVGMAVDANVIVFERIKEELIKGSGVRSAVRDGFGQAFSAIIDANVTTAAVCLVLMYYGSGPIKGFAVTLIWGIITSLFTAIFVTRTFIDFAINKLGLENIISKKSLI